MTDDPRVALPSGAAERDEATEATEATELPDWASPLPADRPIQLLPMPRFSLAWVMVGTALIACMLVLVRQALVGADWAVAIVVAALSALVALAFFAGVYVLAWLVILISGGWRRRSEPSSPFATDTLPPQIVPPTGPE